MALGAAAVPFMIGGSILIVATLELASVFAGLGPGSYTHRALSSLLFGAIVALGGMAGVTFFLLPESGGLGLLQVIVNAVVVAFLYWILSQLPNLLLRFVWGWNVARFPQKQPFGIQDIFTLTTIVALGFGILQVQRSVVPEIAVIKLSQLFVLLIAAAVIHFLLTLPLTYILLRWPEEKANSTAILYIAVLSIGVFAFLISARATPAAAMLLALAIAGYGCFFGVPIMMLRERGVELWTGTRLQSHGTAANESGDELEWSAEEDQTEEAVEAKSSLEDEE